MFKVTIDDGFRNDFDEPAGIYQDLGTVYSIREGFVKLKQWMIPSEWGDSNREYKLDRNLSQPGNPDWVDDKDRGWYFIASDGAALVFEWIGEGEFEFKEKQQ